jgi:hypothetical protein
MRPPERHVWPRLLATLILSLSLTVALLWLLGGTRLPAAQADPLARPLFAPLPTGTDPIPNALNVPITSNVSIAFNEPISLTSVISRTFAAYGSQSPIFTGTYSLSNLSRTVTLDPARNFFPGERVDATVTTATLNITGEQAISSTVWQFWAAVGGGSGRFADSGQSLGSADSIGVALGDVDGDGDLDAFVANSYRSESTANKVWRNDGMGAFAETQSLGNSASYDVTLGDVDSDGDLDAFVANVYGANKVWWNDGTGTFTDSLQSLGSADSMSVALGDVDGDGDLDAFVANYGGGTGEANKVWRNDGMGTFTDSLQSLGSSASTAVALGDVDGDGDLDAFVTNNFNQADKVWRNDGTGTFTETQSLGGADSFGVALGDVDGDGDLDAFVATMDYDHSSGEANKVWRNDGTGTFTETQSLGSAPSYDVALGDLDGDGDLDAFVANRAGANKVWRNDGTGTFTDGNQSLGSADSLGVALGDVDGDGDLDAFVANFGYAYGEANRLWLNRYLVYMPTIMRAYRP